MLMNLSPLSPSVQRYRLSSILVVLFVAQVVGAVGVVGWLSFRNGRRAIDDLANQLMGEVSARIEGQILSHLGRAETVNTMNAIDLKGDLLPTEQPVQLAQHFWGQMKQFPFMTYIYWGGESGEFAGSGRDEIGNLSIGISRNFTQILYPADEQGFPSGPPQFIGENYDPRRRPWYTEAEATGAPTWSSIYVWSDGSDISIDAVHPVYQEDQLLGVTAVSLGLQALSEFLRSLAIGQTGEAFIIERSGNIVANSTPDPPIDFGETGQEPTRLSAFESESLLIRSTTDHLLELYGDLNQVQQPRHLEFDLNGQRQFVRVVPFERGEGIDWIIVVAVPASDFMEQINANTRNTILSAVAALAVAILISIWATRQILRPVNHLIQGSELVARGDLSRRVKLGSRILELERLALSFNGMAQQLKHSFETLEDRVTERTAELAEANGEIRQLNRRLKEENVRLGAEIEVARQLQQLVLPKAEELATIQEFDIAGYMEPADEVGGDYYDVLCTDGIITLAIGDVTGHGLESGILMLMMQTAVRTLQELQERDPVKFLDTLNRAIYKNVKRMDMDKSGTLAVLDYVDGQLSISGQHEETLVVRVNGEIERIDTMDLGFPIGLDDPIAEFVGRARVTLSPGDGIVLYTDGITEAENLAGERYGIERLCEVISGHWSLSAAQIKQAVVRDIKAFIGDQKVYDDITLLVLKRLPQSAQDSSGLAASLQGYPGSQSNG